MAARATEIALAALLAVTLLDNAPLCRTSLERRTLTRRRRQVWQSRLGIPVLTMIVYRSTFLAFKFDVELWRKVSYGAVPAERYSLYLVRILWD
jgi:hypothetical protein